jgi:hypothetical protein
VLNSVNGEMPDNDEKEQPNEEQKADPQGRIAAQIAQCGASPLTACFFDVARFLRRQNLGNAAQPTLSGT